MNERSHCPYLGLRQNRAIRFASPTSEHRCYVTGEAQDIPVEQRTHCLSINHLSCPLYTGEWSGTTSGALAGAGAVALPRGGARGRLSPRDNIFYLAVVGLIGLITLVWIGIYLLYTFGDPASFGGVAVVPATATSTLTPPTATTTAMPTPTLTPDVPPAAPTGLTTASVSTSGVLLEWENKIGEGVRGYNIYRSDASDGPFAKLNLRLIGGAAYNDQTAPRGTISYYRIKAVDAASRESQPATIRVSVPAEPPTATATPSATTTVAPTETLTPTVVPPTPTARVEYIPGPPVYVPVPVVPSRTPVPPTATTAPTDTPVPPTNTPAPTSTTGPTPWPTPIDASTETPVPAPAPPVTPTTAAEPSQSTDASSPAAATAVIPSVVITVEPPAATAPPPPSELPSTDPAP